MLLIFLRESDAVEEQEFNIENIIDQKEVIISVIKRLYRLETKKQ